MKILNSNYTYIVVFAIFNIFHYLQGLETIESEGVEYFFANLDQHIKELFWVDYEDDHAIELAFSKLKIKERNDWLRAPQVWFFSYDYKNSKNTCWATFAPV